MDMSSRPPLTPGVGPAGATDAASDATAGVTALYQAHAVGLIRLAIVMLGDRGAAEDVVLRFYLDLSEEETARAMGVSRGTVKSATSRAVAALGRKLKEGS
jgi:DNA-directed RNA polymerase specialized sigma24 family protein